MKKLITIPDDLHSALKASAHKNQVSLQEHIIFILKHFELKAINESGIQLKSYPTKITLSKKPTKENIENINSFVTTSKGMANDECKTYFKK